MDVTPHFPIYMDYSATNPCDPRVVDAMIPWLREHFGNPASRSHAWGWEAEAAVEKAREQVAALIGADPREIVWTSGATESNNLALKGAAHFYKTKGKHLITVKTEHKAVLDTCRELERQGFEVTYLDVQEDGLVEPGSVQGGHPPRHHPGQRHVREQRDRRDPGHRRHRRPVPREGHHLPRGRGAGHGPGGHRPGDAAGRPDEPDRATRPTAPRASARCSCAESRACGSRRRCTAVATSAACVRARCPRTSVVGMGEAYRIAKAEMHEENARIRALHERMLAGLKDVEQVFINGHVEKRVPHNLNMSFNYVEGESLIMGIKGLAVSSGLGLHLGIAGTQLRAAGARPQRRTGPQQPAHDDRPLDDRGRD